MNNQLKKLIADHESEDVEEPTWEDYIADFKGHRPDSCPMCLIGQAESDSYSIEKNGWAVVKCRNCWGYFALPLSNNAKVDASRFYNERDYLVGQYLSWAHFDFLKRHPAGNTLLDLGTGTGDFVNEAVKAGYDAYGIEMDARAVDAGNKHWKFNRIQVADALSYLRGSSKTWDIITLFAVLEHVTDPNPLFAEVVRHLNAGGCVAINVQNIDTFYAHLWAAVTPGNDYPPNHYTRWSRKSLNLFIQRYGLTPVFRSTCPPSIADNFPDVAISLGHNNKKLTTNLLRVSALATLAMTPVERLLRHVSREGRAQMVIARKEAR